MTLRSFGGTGVQQDRGSAVSCTVCVLLVLASAGLGGLISYLLSHWLVLLLALPETATLGIPWARGAAVWHQTKGTTLSLQSKHDSLLMALVPTEILRTSTQQGLEITLPDPQPAQITNNTSTAQPL